MTTKQEMESRLRSIRRQRLEDKLIAIKAAKEQAETDKSTGIKYYTLGVNVCDGGRVYDIRTGALISAGTIW